MLIDICLLFNLGLFTLPLYRYVQQLDLGMSYSC